MVVKFYNFNKATQRGRIEQEVTKNLLDLVPDGTILPFKFLKEPVFANEEEARKYLENNCSDINGAVLYRTVCMSKTEKNIISELFEISYQKRTLENAHLKKSYSSFVKCRHCKSKIRKRFLTDNFCPVCDEDLRPSELAEEIVNLDNRLKYWEEALKKERANSQSVYRWLVRATINEI